MGSWRPKLYSQREGSVRIFSRFIKPVVGSAVWAEEDWEREGRGWGGGEERRGERGS